MKEFIDFLSEHTPYSRLSLEDRSRLAATIQVETVPAGTVIVPDNSPPLTCQWVVRSGLVEVLEEDRRHHGTRGRDQRSVAVDCGGAG